MLSLGKSNRVANIVVSDYVIRVIENNGKDLTSIKIIEEKQIPADVIVNGKIVDELSFFNLVKQAVQEWGIKNRDVRFYVPNSLVVMRDIDIPNNIIEADVKSYLLMEMGKTIHLPFENPVFDIATTPKSTTTEESESKTYKVTVFAAPEEELIKYMEVFSDASLEPTVVDVQSLGVYRYFLEQQQDVELEDAYLFIEVNLTSLNISIFEKYHLKLLRNQRLDLRMTDWTIDENEYNRLTYSFNGETKKFNDGFNDSYKELERIINFFRYSLSQEESEITEIILTGDIPNLSDLAREMEARLEVKTTVLTANVSELAKHNLGSIFIPAIGLGLKEEK